jgi:Asp-tRNA(Asn)/Glu-tRNA(Gln) amidotransferase A subunit family amidase
MVPLAIGTQTAGSLIRPAAYCGVVGFKPTQGRIPMEGVMALSHTLDQVGTFALTVRAAVELASVMAAADLSPAPQQNPPRYGVYRSPEWIEMEPSARDSLDGAVEILRSAGASVDETVPPAGFDDALPVHRTIMVVEAAANLGPDVARAPGLVSASFRRGVAQGQATPAADYRAALAERERLVVAVARWAAQYDAILCPAATGEAPDLRTTGDPRPCTRWSLVGAPAMTIPVGRGPAGLPLGLQLCGAPGSDRALVAAAQWAEAVFTNHPRLATTFLDGNEVEVIGPA